MVLVLVSRSIKKEKEKERERGVAMVASTLRYVVVLTLNKALPGGSPRFTNPILMLISPFEYSLIMLSCFLSLFSYALV
jgi:hypothetical protein